MPGGFRDNVRRLLGHAAAAPNQGEASAAAIERLRSMLERAGLDAGSLAAEFEDGEQAIMELFATYDVLTHEPLPSLKLALVPAEAGWQVPAYLRFGSWNDCPPPEIHVALLHRWHEEYGTELAVLRGDTIELMVNRPPRTREAALALAQMYYLYAPDSIDQGFGSLDALAASLMVSRIWFLWWD